MTGNQGWYTVRQAAREVGLQPNTVRWHIDKGNLTAIFEQGRYRVSRAELDRFITTRTQIEAHSGGLVEHGYDKRAYKELKKKYIDLFVSSVEYRNEIRNLLAELLEAIDYEKGKPYMNQEIGLCVDSEMLERLREYGGLKNGEA